MSDENELNFLRRALAHIRRTLAVLIFVAGATAGVAGVLWSNSDDLQQQQVQQTEHIHQLELRIQQIEMQQASATPNDSPPGICRCQKSLGNNQMQQQFCPAKNAVCDEESARICEAQFPGYRC